MSKTPVRRAYRQAESSWMRAGDAPNPVERVAGVPASAQGLLLDALADQIQLCPGQCHDVEGSITVTASGMTSVAAVLQPANPSIAMSFTARAKSAG